MGGAAEVQSEQKRANDEVKRLGARMAQDHAKAGDELKQIVARKGLPLPEAPTAELDRAYMAHMVADHKKDIADFERRRRPARMRRSRPSLPTLCRTCANI